ncbi:proline-rich protein HaeIII subfamily 1-like [Culicoides brevitarsis]|uniref:proline-rich protein HaeIII subfamily 1-like n=1 Tax=Culicoides brevitarsis TaxID=469753 RepID=UPI00307B792D
MCFSLFQQPIIGKEMGQRSTFSLYDVAKINALYQCDNPQLPSAGTKRPPQITGGQIVPTRPPFKPSVPRPTSGRFPVGPSGPPGPFPYPPSGPFPPSGGPPPPFFPSGGPPPPISGPGLPPPPFPPSGPYPYPPPPPPFGPSGPFPYDETHH